MELSVDLGANLVAAVAARDADALRGLFAPGVRYRALIPSGLVERHGADDAAALMMSWFADSDPFDLIDSATSTVGDRVHVWYRFTGVEDGQNFVVEQQLYAAVTDGRVSEVSLLCSGFRPTTSLLGDR